MSSWLYGLAGFSQGFSDAYNNARRAKLDRELDERGRIAGAYQTLINSGKVKPEAIPGLLNSYGEVWSAPKWDDKTKKKLSDFSTLLSTPPPGYGEDAKAQGGGFEQLADLKSQTGPINFGGALQNAPVQAPPYSALYSDKELEQMKTSALFDEVAARERAGYTVREQQGRGMGLSGDTLTNFTAGRQITPMFRGQHVTIYDPSDPTHTRSIMATYDPTTGQTYDAAGNVIDNPEPYSAFAAVPTPGRAFIESRLQQGMSMAQAVDEYNTTQSANSGFHFTTDRITGEIKVTPWTGVRTTTRGNPETGTGTGLGAGVGARTTQGIAPPPSASAGASGGTRGGNRPAPKPLPSVGGTRTVGGVTPSAPTNVRAAFNDYQDSKNRYDRMLEDIAMVEKNPTGNVGAYDMDLLSQHIAMTFGSVRGARTGEELIQAHIKARSIPEDLVVLYNRLTMGQQLSPQQRQNFLHLGKTSFDLAQRKYESTVQETQGGYGLGTGNGINPPPSAVGTGMVDVEVNGQRGRIPRSQLDAFKKKYPGARVF